jgi:hypothetical protein
MLVHQDAAQFGAPAGRILERGEDDRPLVDREREQLDVVLEGLLEPVCQLVGVGRAEGIGELRDRVDEPPGRRRASSGHAIDADGRVGCAPGCAPDVLSRHSRHS